MKRKLNPYRHHPFWHDEYRHSYGIDHNTKRDRRLFFILLAIFIAIILVAWLIILPSFPEYVHQWWHSPK